MLGFVTWLQVLLGLNIVAVCCKNLVKVGVILPMKGKHPWILPLARPAIDYAVDNIQKNPNILPNHVLVTNYKDSQCSETEGPLVAIDMYVEKSAHVFLGPACDYSVAPVARFSYKWNIPVLTAGALVSAFHDKGEYKLLTRVLGSYAMTGRFFVELCYDFGWTHVGMMYHDFKTSPNQGKSDCFFVMEAIYFAMNTRFGKPWHLHFDEEGDEVDFEAFLLKAAKNARTPWWRMSRREQKRHGGNDLYLIDAIDWKSEGLTPTTFMSLGDLLETIPDCVLSWSGQLRWRINY